MRATGAVRKPAGRNHLIASAASTLEVLEIIGSRGAPMPLAAIAEAMGRPKASVHRMVATLVNTGYLAQDPGTSQYSLTMKLWRLGASSVGRFDIVKVARPWMERLVTETDETVHLSTLDPSGGIVYVARVESPRSIRVQTQIGQLSPSWCTATGRCMLAWNPEVADHVLSLPLGSRTERTVTDPRRIRSALRDVLARGYAVTQAENHPEMGGIAAPIRDHSGAASFSLGIGIPVFRMNRDLIARCVPFVVRAAAAVSQELGYQPGGSGSNAGHQPKMEA